jgi:hypothetical protein
MWYDWQPVYHDPPSNNWTGMQGWGMERVCSLYYMSGNEKAGTVCRDWVDWLKQNTRVNGGEIVHATNLKWSGNPDEWNASNFNRRGNKSLHGTVSSEGVDLGTAASLMKALYWFSLAEGDQEGFQLVGQVMDAMEAYKDDLGYASEEAREDYKNFGQETYIPSGWSGKNAQGANIKSGATFIDIRPKYKEDPDWAQVEDFLNGGSAPRFTYHRFWAQTEIAVANGVIAIYGGIEPGNIPDKKDNKEVTTCPASITRQGYKCCHVGCTAIYTDGDGDWDVENGQWCGCGSAPVKAKCPAAITSQGYPCCSSCGVVWYTDADGEWGVENNNWCGMPSNC